MTISYSFEYELPSGQPIQVESEITEPTPGKLYGEPSECYPAEAGSAEIILVTTEDHHKMDLSDLWVRHASGITVVIPPYFTLFLEDLAETAYENWCDSHD